MKKIIGAIGGCIVVYYVIDVLVDVLAALSMACAWLDLVEYGHMQAAHDLDDTFHKKYCKSNQMVFDFTKEVLLEDMKRK